MNGKHVRLFLLWFLCSAVSSDLLSLYAQGEAVIVSRADIAKLSQISMRLKSLNEQLSNELLHCNVILSEQLVSIATSEAQLTELKAQLEVSQQKISAYGTTLEASGLTLQELRSQVRALVTALETSRKSLDELKKKADADIVKWKAISIGAPVAVTVSCIVWELIIRPYLTALVR